MQAAAQQLKVGGIGDYGPLFIFGYAVGALVAEALGYAELLHIRHTDVLLQRVELLYYKLARARDVRLVHGDGQVLYGVGERLAEDGNEVIVVEMAPIVGNGIFYYNVVKTQQFLTERGATIKTNTALREIKDGAIVVEPWHGKFVSASLKGMRNINGYVAAGEAEQTGPYEIPVDCTVLSLGIRPDSSLLEALEDRFENVVAIGDCVNPGRIGDATGAAFLAVKNL